MSKALGVRVLFKGQEISSQTFKADSIVIGRDESCDVRLDNAGVSRHHALIERKGPVYLLRDLGSSNGTIVGDETISLWEIKDRGKARITKFDLEFRLLDGPPQDRHDPDTAVPGLGGKETMVATQVGPIGAQSETSGSRASRARGNGNRSLIAIAVGGGILAALIYLIL